MRITMDDRIIELVEGDITKQEVDAIGRSGTMVSPANPSCWPAHIAAVWSWPRNTGVKASRSRRYAYEAFTKALGELTA